MTKLDLDRSAPDDPREQDAPLAHAAPPPHDVPLLHIVDGKEIIPGDNSWLVRCGRFLAEPFTSAWRNRDLIAAILRRELRERFSGSVAGWVWAILAPLLSLITYTLVFSGAVKLPNNADASSPIDYALFVFGGLMLWIQDWRAGWLHGKLTLVVVMTVMHHLFALWRKDFAADRNSRSARFYRFMNEVPTLLMIGIVILVIVKPF